LLLTSTFFHGAEALPKKTAAKNTAAKNCGWTNAQFLWRLVELQGG